MKKIIVILLSFFLILLLLPVLYFTISACGVSPLSCGEYKTAGSPTFQKIMVGYGPEDMALDTMQGHNRIIVSCSSRRESGPNEHGFYAIQLDDRRSKALSIIPKELDIHPHGIDIVSINNTTFLYAISHDGLENDKHRIYRFSISGDTLLLDEDFTLSDKLLTGPNDLDVLDDGSFFVSNPMPSDEPMESTKAILGIKNGNVLHYDGAGTWSVAVKDLCYPNGVWVDQEDSYLLIANGGCQEVLKYKINSNKVDAESKMSTGEHGMNIPIGDNLLIDDEGVLWTAAHPCPLKFVEHVKATDNKSPAQVFTIDPMTLKTNMVFQNNGSLISAASTALHYKDRLFISQVFDPFVLVLDY
jgi:sugar lactone lactonase YvrE